MKRKLERQLKIVIETSTLVSASICWKYEEDGYPLALEHCFYKRCRSLIEYCKNEGLSDNVIITKTVEDEAKNAIKRAVEKTIRDNATPNLVTKYGLMVLQHIVLNEALDKLDYYVEECSTRFPINRKERDIIKKNEIEPFLAEISSKTLRYIQPSIPRFIAKPLRDELTAKIVESLPSKGIVYKGMPGDRDLTIMAEAALIYRKFECKEEIYVASEDNHFKPNPVQIGSFYDSSMRFSGDVDSTVRDMLAEKFGFIGEDPRIILAKLKKGNSLKD